MSLIILGTLVHAGIYLGQRDSSYSNAGSATPFISTNGKLVSWLTGPSFYGCNGIAYDSINGNLYVANDQWHNITVVNATTNQVEGNISGFYYPLNVVVDSHANELAVTNEFLPLGGYTNTSVYDISTGKMVHVFNSTRLLTIDQLNGNFFIASGSNISVISGTSWKLLGNTSTGTYVTSIHFDTPLNDLLVGTNQGTIEVLNGTTGKFVKTITPKGLSLENGSIYTISTDSSGKIIYFSESNYLSTVGALDIPDGSTLWLNLNAFDEVIFMTYDPNNSLLYLSDGVGQLFALDSFNGEIFNSFGLYSAGGQAYVSSNNAVYVATGGLPYSGPSGILIVHENYGPVAQANIFHIFEGSGIAIIAVISLAYLYTLRRKNQK